jgi:hypothetical protein
MQEMVTLLYGSFLLIEMLALLIADPVMVLAMRACSAGVAALCHWLRELNTSERHSVGRSLYYAQLLYLFACMDLCVYLSITALMLFLPTAYSLWLYLYVAVAWFGALYRLYREHFCSEPKIT